MLRIIARILAASMALFIVMDPIGNLPLLAVILKGKSRQEWQHIVLRESLIALAIFLVCFFCGNTMMKVLGIADYSLSLAGGLLLLLIALKAFFGQSILPENQTSGKILLVPLAIPLIAGPSSIVVILLSRGQYSLLIGLSSLFLAWTASTLILLSGRYLFPRLGKDIMNALQSLMAFILAIMSVQMIVRGAYTVIKHYMDLQ